MAGGGGGRGSGFSYKKITLVVCFCNILIALYVLHSLYASLYIYSNGNNVVSYTPDQITRMEEFNRIRRSKEPVELVKLVKKLKQELSHEESAIELSDSMKQRIADDILKRLKSLGGNANATDRLEAVELWRREKLKETKSILEQVRVRSTDLQDESGMIVVEMLVKALESGWASLSEEIGLWLPAAVTNKEHDDKPEGEEEPEEVLAGRVPEAECRPELHTDYDGVAVRWGLTHHKESAADCCQACIDQARRAKPGQVRCNIWVYCPSEFGCFSPDVYEHKHMECWLKYAEKPKVNFKNRYSESYRNSHPKAPVIVPWVSGVIAL